MIAGAGIGILGPIFRQIVHDFMVKGEEIYARDGNNKLTLKTVIARVGGVVFGWGNGWVFGGIEKPQREREREKVQIEKKKFTITKSLQLQKVYKYTKSLQIHKNLTNTQKLDKYTKT